VGGFYPGLANMFENAKISYDEELFKKYNDPCSRHNNKISTADAQLKIVPEKDPNFKNYTPTKQVLASIKRQGKMLIAELCSGGFLFPTE